VKNNSSVEYLIHFEGGNPIALKGLSSVFIKELKAGQSLLVIDNAWYGEDKHLTLEISVD
jgi:hypothetical protein